MVNRTFLSSRIFQKKKVGQSLVATKRGSNELFSVGAILQTKNAKDRVTGKNTIGSKPESWNDDCVCVIQVGIGGSGKFTNGN